MNLSNEYPVTIFRNEYEGRTFYKMGLSKKLEDGSYENGSIACRFKKVANVEDKTKIYIKSAWLTFYKKDKTTIPYVFINEFETVGQVIENSKVEVKQESDPFEDFGNDVVITDEDLPF